MNLKVESSRQQAFTFNPNLFVKLISSVSSSFNIYRVHPVKLVYYTSPCKAVNRVHPVKLVYMVPPVKLVYMVHPVKLVHLVPPVKLVHLVPPVRLVYMSEKNIKNRTMRSISREIEKTDTRKKKCQILQNIEITNYKYGKEIIN